MITPPLFFLLFAAAAAQPAPAPDLEAWQAQAKNVTIIRDDWGIAHVYGKTDADTVFGAMYAQAEDDFNRIETNYLTSLGRLAEAEGESKLTQDLRMRLFIDPADLKAKYEKSPLWLQKLMQAFANGLNFYLATHPETKPRVITRFEPWMALSFTEGSIGGDIESINLNQLEAFYTKKTPPNVASIVDLPEEPRGSNGVAIAPSNTASKRGSLLLINPHTSFFFRSELQMVSEEGLNAYGASTWGQFFIYQGFNERAGWMHTSSGIDTIDEYLETVEKVKNNYVYRYAGRTRPVRKSSIELAFRKKDGEMAAKSFTVYKTHHGPIIREENGKWVAVRLMHEPVKALTQSYLRTKARDYKAFLQTMELKTNSSNNTIYADADGTIAYFHGNFLPRRNRRFDWTKPVDGSDRATEWGPLHLLKDLPSFKNPSSGWLYNTNNSPWSAAGPDSPRKENYPAYVESGVENPRGLHAISVLKDTRDFTLDSLLAAAYDSYLPWFEKPLPALIKAWDALNGADPRRPKLAQQIEMLRGWNLRWSVSSVPTSLGVYWGEELRKRRKLGPRGVTLDLADYAATKASPQELLECLEAASAKLEADFGKWNTAWGDINRFQRNNGDIVQQFNDNAPSTPVGFTSAVWGSLASFGARAYPGTKKWYGTSGNSFVAAVEFTPDRVRARAVSAGGENGNPASRHFNDQADRYAAGDLREVYFYKDQLQGHTERQYQPGVRETIR
jgi:acyl-homoserine-lactone acylase